ncbi:DUF1653 domain-containing protein [Legionella saoudiensis]|uniref:DUF1653 domain-containing protein n=1 Tax=Legionella saoudiensis TaxID=1750561 RepID=UPI0007307089|nr:DUF1653 domain-containing protein [Legionella saoudiensis]
MLADSICGKYRHYKNEKLYEVIGLARHSETEEDMVVYKALYHCDDFGENQLWVRPKHMFFENVIHNGKTVPRFQRVA